MWIAPGGSMSNIDGYLQVMRTRVRSDRRQTLLVGGLLAFLMVLLFFFVPANDSDSKLPLTLVAILGVVYCGWTGLRPVDAQPGIAALAAGGRDIVWIYVQRLTRGGAHSASRLHLGLVNRNLVWLEVPKERDDEFMRAVAESLPHATSGYDPDLQERFFRDPASMRRS
jgi:hypothetical protein